MHLCTHVYLNMFVQGRVSIMGKINDAKERDVMIDGRTKIDINNNKSKEIR